MSKRRSTSLDEGSSVAPRHQKNEPKEGAVVKRGRPCSLVVAARGIRTGNDFADLMSALMQDVVGDRISAATCNAACNAAGKLLRVVELQLRYGTSSGEKGERTLRLTALSA